MGLAQGTIVEIVKVLMEVQQATEKQNMIIKNEPQASIAAADDRFKEELRQHDMKLVTQLDQKLSEQQVTLERAGLPGFYVTNNPTEIQVQMYLLQFILKIGNHEV